MRFLIQNIAIKARQHIVGLMTADASRNGIHRHTVGGQAGDDQVHIARGIAPTAGGDGVPEKCHFLAGLDEDFSGSSFDKRKE